MITRYCWSLYLFAISVAASAQSSVNVRFSINAGITKPISPYLYGTHQPNWSTTSHYLTLSRLGGNRWTAYNWENNASNAGTDWFNQNDGYLGGGEVAGEAVRGPVQQAFNNNASMIVTIPICGYAAADKNPPGDVNQTPNYLQVRFRQVKSTKGSAFTYPPSLADAFVYEDEFVSWLENQFPRPPSDPRKIFYCLDNEPDLWSSTHPRIHANPATYAEMIIKTTDFANAIKSVKPTAEVFGPVSYGWYGYVRLQGAPDNNNRDFLDFYMDQIRAASQTAGKRLIDVLDLHWYPEAKGDGVRITGEETTPGVVAARVQAPRSLWDPTYSEDSWIVTDWLHAPIRLIPLMFEKIAAHYPGTKLGITEYNYGGGAHISGGIAEADVLGVFGREGLYAATLWELNANESFIYAGMSAFRNYDGAGSVFGDTSLLATTTDIPRTSIYASTFSSGPAKLVIVAINKSLSTVNGSFVLANASSIKSIRAYRLTGSAPAMIPISSKIVRSPRSFLYSMPPMSVTTLAIN